MVTNSPNITDLYDKIEEVIISWVEKKTEIAWNKSDFIISEIDSRLNGFKSLYQYNIVRSILEAHKHMINEKDNIH